jgi:hypothetical protein
LVNNGILFIFRYAEQPNKEGAAFGHEDVWKGLSIAIDTFDNDRAVRSFFAF